MSGISKYTVSLMHFDKDFKDECGTIWVPKGSPKIASPGKFKKSLQLDGLSALYTQPIVFGTNDFTIECFVYAFPKADTYGVIFSNGASTQVVNMPAYLNLFLSGTTLNFYYTGKSGSYIIADTNVATLVLKTWNHISVVKLGTTIYIFLNGTLVKTYTGITELPSLASKTFCIGDYLLNGYDRAFIGYIDEFEVNNGLAKYTQNFQVPSFPFVNYDNMNYLYKIQDLYGYK